MIGAAEASVYTDLQGLGRLRAKAGRDDPEALREVARQFESLFVHMMLKGMRDASLGEGAFDSKQTQFYQGMFDQQIALELSRGQGLGLAEVLVRQLEGRAPVSAGPEPAPPPAPGMRGPGAAPAASSAGAADGARSAWRPESPAAFVADLWPHARAAAERLGLPAEVLVAQSALETGWGQAVMRRPDGASSYNLFGIKADSRWEGDAVTVPTLEFESGIPVRRHAAFRAYDSPAESFQDYVRFLQDNPRYREALDHGGDPRAFVAGLARAGYATDPEYASKINGILGSDRFQVALARIKPAG